MISLHFITGEEMGDEDLNVKTMDLVFFKIAWMEIIFIILFSQTLAFPGFIFLFG